MSDVPPLCQRIALQVQYLGTDFFGWQRQPRHRSVQGDLEEAIARCSGQFSPISGAGRTDTGVHASAQVAHFDTHSPIPVERWAFALNNVLPTDIVIRQACAVTQDWHARFSATWRSYRYAIWNTHTPDVFWRLFSWHHRPSLAVGPMSEALQTLLGDNDLEVFRLSGSKRAHSRVQIQSVRCWRTGPLVWIDVKASGFLYRMMRLLVGALASVGMGTLSTAEFERMWRDRERPIRFSVPPQGLCLTGVGYPSDPFLASQTVPSGSDLSLDGAGRRVSAEAVTSSVAGFPYAFGHDRGFAESPAGLAQ